jgi:hypothetical protein
VASLRSSQNKTTTRHSGLTRSAYLTSSPRMPFTTSPPHNQSLPNRQRPPTPQASYLSQCPATSVYNTKRSLFLGLVVRTRRFSAVAQSLPVGFESRGSTRSDHFTSAVITGDLAQLHNHLTLGSNPTGLEDPADIVCGRPGVVGGYYPFALFEGIAI